MFLHGGFFHLAGNMLYLWIFGDNVEDRVGRGRFIAFYLICGAIAALAQALPDMRSTVPMIGASGAVSGVLGAYVVLYPRANVLVAMPFVLARVPALDRARRVVRGAARALDARSSPAPAASRSPRTSAVSSAAPSSFVGFCASDAKRPADNSLTHPMLQAPAAPAIMHAFFRTAGRMASEPVDFSSGRHATTALKSFRSSRLPS